MNVHALEHFGASQQPFGGDVSIILPMRSSAGTPGGAQNWAGSRPLSRFPIPLRRGALPGLSVLLFPMPLRAPVQRSRKFRRFGLTPCAGTRRPADGPVTTFYTYPERRRL